MKIKAIAANHAYLEDLLDTLNGTVYQQQQEIDRLKNALKSLSRRVEQVQSTSGSANTDEVPPHY